MKSNVNPLYLHIPYLWSMLCKMVSVHVIEWEPGRERDRERQCFAQFRSCFSCTSNSVLPETNFDIRPTQSHKFITSCKIVCEQSKLFIYFFSFVFKCYFRLYAWEYNINVSECMWMCWWLMIKYFACKINQIIKWKIWNVFALDDDDDDDHDDDNNGVQSI